LQYRIPLEMMKAVVIYRKLLTAKSQHPLSADSKALMALAFVCRYWNRIISSGIRRHKEEMRRLLHAVGMSDDLQQYSVHSFESGKMSPSSGEALVMLIEKVRSEAKLLNDFVLLACYKTAFLVRISSLRISSGKVKHWPSVRGSNV
jgi:hypothetical protein